MNLRPLYLLAAVAALSACQTTAPDTSTPSYHFACDNGQQLDVRYPDTDTAVLLINGKTLYLRNVVSASGARYVGYGWQWWTKGSSEGYLAPIKDNEDIASAQGVACRAQ